MRHDSRYTDGRPVNELKPEVERFCLFILKFVSYVTHAHPPTHRHTHTHTLRHNILHRSNDSVVTQSRIFWVYSYSFYYIRAYNTHAVSVAQLIWIVIASCVRINWYAGPWSTYSYNILIYNMREKKIKSH